MTGTRHHRGVERIFDRVARGYDTPWLQAALYAPVQDAVMAELRSAGVRRIVDAGCGTGILAGRLAAELPAGLVCGVDLSPGMLARARSRSGDAVWVHGNALHPPCPTAPSRPSCRRKPSTSSTTPVRWPSSVGSSPPVAGS